MTSELVLLITLALASYRLWRILGKDSWPPSVWFRQRLGAEAFAGGGTANRTGSRPWWKQEALELIECPWCMGFWIAGAVVANLWPWDTLAELAVAWLAVSCLVGLIGARLDD